MFKGVEFDNKGVVGEDNTDKSVENCLDVVVEVAEIPASNLNFFVNVKINAKGGTKRYVPRHLRFGDERELGFELP